MAENIFIISGPSGSGQDSIIEGLRRDFEIERVITTTDRPMRLGEGQGYPYYFISTDEFQQKIVDGAFLEYAQEYNGRYYGVTAAEIERVSRSGKIGIWKIEYQGVLTAKKLFPGIVAIMINTPDLGTLERRIRGRDKNRSEKYIRERMEYTREWLKHKDIYDYEVINADGHLGLAIDEVARIIRKYRDGQIDQENPDR